MRRAQRLLLDAAETMRLSARAYHRVLRVARTLADLDGAEKITRLHLAEALSYRALADDVWRGLRDAEVRCAAKFGGLWLSYPWYDGSIKHSDLTMA